MVSRSGYSTKKEYYEWDFEHRGEIEVYDHNGVHKKVIDPKTGEEIKPAIKGRDIKDKIR